MNNYSSKIAFLSYSIYVWYPLLEYYFFTWRTEICDNTTTEGIYVGDVVMCPECDKYCPYWKLDKSCSVSKVAYLFDNYGTVVFSIVMSIWGEYLREIWNHEF